MSVYADLHVHTTNSDGTLQLSDVPDAARDAGVSVVAITDHDSIHPELSSRVVEYNDIVIIRGIELRVEVEEINERVDLLGYCVQDTPELNAELERLQADRFSRSQAIIENVERELGVELDIVGRKGMGRPHIARAIASNTEIEYGYEEAFSELIGNGCPAYVSREVTSFERGVELLSNACSFVSLAHPGRYTNYREAVQLTEELDGIEGPYLYETPIDMAPVFGAIEKYNLVVTGGSDAHEKTIGGAGLTWNEYQAFKSAADF